MKVGTVETETETVLLVAQAKKMVRTRSNDEKLTGNEAGEDHLSTLGGTRYAKVKYMPEVRAARLIELRHQIEAGTYHLNSTALARKILGLHPFG
jgi:anti-sigma28 factor (negative regulator of flagellin synthesis)